MLLGKVAGSKSAPLVSSAPKSAPFVFSIPGITTPARLDYVRRPAVATADDLSPVAVTVKKIAIPDAPADEEIPEIVVSGNRIPWYAWALGGVAGFAILDSLLGRKG